MTDEIHLVRLVLDRRALSRVAARHRLPSWVDDGYLLHAGLSQLFAASSAPAEVPLESFALDDAYAASQGGARELLYVLGYAREPAPALELRMGPARGELLRGFASRPVPRFERGQRAEFRTRVCPVVRTKQAGDRVLAKDARGRAKSREIDAFQHRTLGLDRSVPVSREAVYVEWLRARVAAAAGGGCDIGSARLAEFRREVMRRRGDEGKARIERPNAVLEGELTVTDPAAFTTLLARGIGRHRAFGFGMLLLRPPGAR